MEGSARALQTPAQEALRYYDLGVIAHEMSRKYVNTEKERDILRRYSNPTEALEYMFLRQDAIERKH